MPYRSVLVHCDCCPARLPSSQIFPHWLAKHSLCLPRYPDRAACDECDFLTGPTRKGVLFQHFARRHADLRHPGWAALSEGRRRVNNDKTKATRKYTSLYSCDECGRGFRRHDILATHFAQCHSESLGAGWSRFREELRRPSPRQGLALHCDSCAYATSYRDCLAKHIAVHHSTEDAWRRPKWIRSKRTLIACDDCGQSAAKANTFDHFVRRHADVSASVLWKEKLAALVARIKAGKLRRGRLTCDGCGETRGKRESLFKHYKSCRAGIESL